MLFFFFFAVGDMFSIQYVLFGNSVAEKGEIVGAADSLET